MLNSKQLPLYHKSYLLIKYSYTYSSPAIANLLGITSKQVMGQTPFDLLAAAQDVNSITNLQTTLTTHKAFKKLEKNFLHADKSIVVLQTSGVPITDPAGNLQNPGCKSYAAKIL